VMSGKQTSSAAGPAELLQTGVLERDDWRWLAAGSLVIFLAAFAVYWPAMRGQFLWDDILVVQRNPLVTGEIGFWSIWFRMDFPLSNVAFWLERLAWGDHPVGYHVVNVLLHATGAVLLWRVLAQLKVPAGWLAAMIFTVHPLCVASVAWISELKNTLSLPFFLLSILWYVRSESDHRVSGIGYWFSRWYCLSLVAFVLALVSKTSTVMLPVVLLGCAWWQRGYVGRRDWLRTSPFFALALAFGLMSIGFQVHGAMAEVAVQSEHFWARLAAAGMAVWFYLGKALLPLHLSMIYPRWKIEAASGWSYLPLVLWCGVLAASWVGRRSWGRSVLFGLGCFTVTLFPVLGFFDLYFLALSRVSDHFAYLPLTALAALGAAGLSRTLRGRVLAVVGAGLVIVLAVLAFLRAPVFVSAEALWRDTLEKNPAAWCAHANLGWILASQQKYDEARDHLVASLKVNPNNAPAHSNLGRVLAAQRQFAAANEEFQAAVRMKPKDVEFRRSYAAALAEQGKPQEAMRQLEELLEMKPDPAARLQLATLLRQGARFAEAAAQYRQVLGAKPEDLEALNNVAWLLASCSDDTVRDGAAAVRFAERGCRLTDYKQAQMVGALAAAYAEAGRFPEAVTTVQMAITLARANGNAQFAAASEQLLRLYQAGRPYHMPPPTAPRPGTDRRPASP
jgi:protein O-mannosyl-transferase